ncbi:MAG: hypothetical protein K6C08_06500 [Oscillospiraceae bacterium]|nr:hypothetical protein [Oscillospiraceae bacterium]
MDKRDEIPADLPEVRQEQAEPVQSDRKQAEENLRMLAREIEEDKKIRKLRRRQRQSEEKRKFPTWFLRRKARRLRWKKEKYRRRDELKTRYQDAPWLIRLFRLYLLKPVTVLLVLAIVTGALGYGFMSSAGSILDVLFETRNNPVSQEEIYKMSPIDEDGAERIDAVAPVDSDDTWTISVYLVGSNLEDMNENDLAQVVLSEVKDIQEQTETARKRGYKERLASFSRELENNGLEIPAYLYYPDKPVPSDSSEGEQSGPVIAEAPGCASADIGEMTSDIWSDNISIVIQTGGATRWSNSMVNPNRTQRFLYHGGVFSEVDNQPLQPAAAPETLTSFLNFCRQNYPADHNMLVLWNHGGGVFGYGSDSIYGNMMSLKDLRDALEGAYEPNEKKPAFDVIGFDACLMSSLEVTHALNGFASYFAVSEETEPGDGWDYSPWLRAMTENPTMSPAKIAQNIADSYMDYYVTQNINIGVLITNNVTFSVLDASKTEELYEAWCELTKHQLIDAAADSSVLTEIGQCSYQSTHLASSVYNIYNTIDLGNYVDLMADSYPEECSRIRELIGEAVMYHRESGSLSDSQGISVYVPGTVNNYAGLSYCLNFIYDICEDPSTKALYYYKIAGCLNEEMEEHLATLTDVEAQTLDLRPFLQFAKTEPVITDDGFDIPVEENLQTMLQNCELEIAHYDDRTGTVTDYGRDERAYLDGDGHVSCDFDGTWICYDGVPLATEVVSATGFLVEYRSKVLYNGDASYLSFTWDRNSETFTVNGIKGVSDLSGVLDSDPINYLVNSRMTTEVKEGDVIVPLYEVNEVGSDHEEGPADSGRGSRIKVSKDSEIRIGKLPSGYYLTSAVISDQRGDVYYSQVVGSTVSEGTVSDREVNTAFVGRDY